MIPLQPETRARLDGVKVHPRESYDETLKKIEEGIADIRAGRYRSLEDSAQELGLE